MLRSQKPGACAVCGGEKRSGTTTFTVDLGTGVVVVRGVPAEVCGQCGADWIDDHTAEKIEHLIAEARNRHSEVEVLKLTA